MGSCVAHEELEGLHAGTLSADDRARVLAHLESCDDCRELNRKIEENNALFERVQDLPTADTPLNITRTSTEPGSFARDNPPPNINIPGFDIRRVLGRGGQGVVYRAVQASTKQKVAIKVLIEGVHASESTRQRFEREIDLAAQLKHPYIVRVTDSGKTPEGQPYYVMDYVAGVPLNQYVVENQPTLEESLRLFSKVCEAVQFAHHRGVIHRDLKPTNILVDAKGDPRLLDFGMAKWLAAPVDNISLSQAVIGTLPYMSPEQTRGNPANVDARADIYALGVVLYELLTGHYPIPVAENMAEMLDRIANQPPTPPTRQWTVDSGITTRSSRRVRSGSCPIDDEVQTMVLKALQKEPLRRYQSAGEFAGDINHYLAGEPIDAKRDSALYVLRVNLRRHKGIVVTAATMLAVAAIVFFAWRGKANKDRATQLALQAYGEVTRNRLTKAGALLEEAFTYDPDNYAATAFMAHAQEQEYYLSPPTADRSDALQDALDSCEKALAMKPTAKGMWNLKCALLHELGKPKEAEQACLRSIELDENYYFAYSNLAKILATQQRFDEAIDMAKKGTEKQPKDKEKTREGDGIWLTLGTLQMVTDPSAAYRALSKAIELDGVQAKNHLMMAKYYLTIADPPDAKRALEEALLAYNNAQRTDPQFDRILALAYLRNERYHEAETRALIAIEKGGDRSINNCILAIARAKLGDPIGAARYLTAASRQSPSFADGTIVTARKELLWIDTEGELRSLTTEAHTVIAALNGRNPDEAKAQEAPPSGS